MIIKRIATLFIAFCMFGNMAKTQNQTKEETLKTNTDIKGIKIMLEYKTGESYNHPTMAIWVENIEGELLQTLYVTESLATGTYKYGDSGKGHWKRESGEARRPATLPYWLHKRGVQADDGTFLPTPKKPLPDAITGATPKQNFTLESNTDLGELRKFKILLEINQSWDWNKHWHNNKYPDDKDYFMSSQPAVVYAVTVDLDSEIDEYFMNPIGHSHYSGKDGNLYTDLSTLTTALKIVEKVKIIVKE